MRVAVILVVFFALFWALFFSFQNKTVYRNTLGYFSNNYIVNEEGKKDWVQKPYQKLDQKDYIQWDGVHYYLIAQHGYDLEKAGGEYIFAFFPLFPAIWGLSGLPPLGGLFLNYAFLGLSLFILLKTFSSKGSEQDHLLLALSLPSMAIFFIPYTEACFLLVTSIGIRGFMKDSYGLFFVGFLLAALARPAFTILALSLVGTELFFLPTHWDIGRTLKNLFFRLLPLVIGTALVAVIQWFEGSGSLTKFMEVREQWNTVLQVPHNLRGWSKEGFAINIGVLFFFFAPFFVLFFIKFIDQILSSFTEKARRVPFEKGPYLIILSMIYTIGACSVVLLFRGGSLHCLFRYVLCNPFTYVLLFKGFPYVQRWSWRQRIFIWGTLSLLSLLVLGLAQYSTYWDFRDLGFFLLSGVLLLWIFQDLRHYFLYRVLLYSFLGLNLVWTTYLFNSYISNGWIFA